MPFLAGRRVIVAGTLTAIRPQDGHAGEVHATIYLDREERKPRSHEEVLDLLHRDLAKDAGLQAAAGVTMPKNGKRSLPAGRSARDEVLDLLDKVKKSKAKAATDWKARRFTPPKGE